MSWEIIPSRTNGARPILEPKVDLTVRVQHCRALLAWDRLVFDQSHALDFLEWGVDSTHGDDDPRLCELVAGPVVP